MSKPFKGRREDARFVQGAGRYSSDWNLPNQLHAIFVRSPHAHARITSIDTTDAEQSPGVVAVLTGKDVAGSLHTLKPHLPFAGRGGTPLLVPERPALARDAVHHAGEEVAVVLAETRHQASDAAELVLVEYEELPAVIGVDTAIAAGAPLVHPEIAGNICFEHEYGDAAQAAAAIAAAAHVIRLTLDSPRVSPNPMEPRAVLASFDGATGDFEIACSNQGANEMSGGLAQMLGTEPARIRVKMVDVGGAFGPRGSAYPEYAVLLHAARVLGRPVKWVSTRAEDFLVDSQGRGIALAGELALDVDGNFLALRTRWLCDQGAYLTGGGTITNLMNGQLIAAGPYRTQVLYGHHSLVMTNSVPVNAYRGAARPDAAYLIERLVDQAAFELGIDQFELRRRNAIQPAQMPYTTPSGSVFDSGDFPRLLEIAERESAWAGFPVRRDEARARGVLRGIGCAFFLEPSGGGAAPRDEVLVRFSREGKIRLYMAPRSNGQGHETVFAELVADWLGIDPLDIELRAGDPDGPRLVGGGSFGSRSTMTQGSVLKIASAEIIQKGTPLAAEMLEAAAHDIAFANGRYSIAGTDRAVTMADVIRHHGTPEEHPLDTLSALQLPRAYPSGVHVAEIEIDPETGVVTVLSYVAADDIGLFVNKVLAEGQIQGGVVQGAGQALCERSVYDKETGQLIAGSFMDYAMPRAGMIPGVRITDASVPSPNNPLGAKGVGESGTVGAAPTIMNAVMSALRQAGLREFDMPASPDRVWAALHATP